MRILNMMFGKGLGGLEQVALDYHRAIKTHGHTVKTLLRSGAKLPPPGKKNIDHAHVNLSFLKPLSLLRLNREIKSFQPDLMILHGNRPMEYFGPQKTHPVKRVFVAHNYRAKKTIHNMDGIIAVSSPVCDHVVSLGYPANNAYVINNMTDIEPITPHKMDEGNPIFGMLTRLHPVKGVDIFIDALALLKSQGLTFSAKIAGDGPEKEALIAQAKELGLENEIEFIGWIENKSEFLESIDILAIPSRSEAFPVVVVEALSAGIPFIISDLKGPCSVLTEADEALIIPPENKNALADAMKRLSSETNLRQHMLQCQHQKSVNFTFETVSEKLTKTLQTIIDKQV